jgi:hypothetical protein
LNPLSSPEIGRVSQRYTSTVFYSQAGTLLFPYFGADAGFGPKLLLHHLAHDPAHPDAVANVPLDSIRFPFAAMLLPETIRATYRELASGKHLSTVIGQESAVWQASFPDFPRSAD